MFNAQPTLSSAAVLLRPLEHSDFDNLYKVASDPLIWEQHPKNDRYKPEVFKAFFTELMNYKGALIAINQATKDVMGSSTFYNVSPDKSECTIGFTFLARRYWGGVYNPQIKTLMLNHAFKNFESILFEIGPQNFRSQQAILKIGAQFLEDRIKTDADGTKRTTRIYIMKQPK